MGRSFASRVAASLLTAAGLPELITATPAAYEASATTLGLQPRRLNQIKRKLAAGLADCALFDSRRHVRHIESAYLSMYARARAHMPPDDIHVQSVGITAPVH
jgi:predicted O-linked N-acetylglucosamine transferase (SPINDLY family)